MNHIYTPEGVFEFDRKQVISRRNKSHKIDIAEPSDGANNVNILTPTQMVSFFFFQSINLFLVSNSKN